MNPPPPFPLPLLLGAFLVHAAVLSGLGLAAQVWLQRALRRVLSPLETVVLGAVAPALAGYAAFWIYFASPLAGRIFSWAALGAVGLTLAWAAVRSRGPRLVVPGRLLALMLLVGVCYLATLALYPTSQFTATARDRFMVHLPGDNEIPRIFAERLYIGMAPKKIGGDWLSSDRPPLQAGLVLVAFPALAAAHLDIDLICGTAGVWFQLLWIPALWAFLRWLGATEREAHAGTAALTFTGFLLLHSVFVWPKLGGAALVLLAFVVLFSEGAPFGIASARVRFVWAALLAALGTLAHGGTMFSLLAFAPLAAARLWREPRATLLAAVVFLALTQPWSAYRHFYEPPGNRLVKWHLAGVIPPDERSFGEALRDSYRAVGWQGAWQARRDNVALIFSGSWRQLLTPHAGAAAIDRRGNEGPYSFRMAAVWIAGLLAAAWLAVRTVRGRSGWRGLGRRHALAVGWLALTLLVWVALMFLPNSTFIHQGSLVTQVLALGLLATWLLFCGRWVFLAVAAVQTWLFFLTWMPPSAAVTWPPNLASGVLCIATASLVAGLAVQALFSAEPAVAPRTSSLRPWYRRLARAALEDWRGSRSAVWIVGLAALLLFLRKPWALHTPQLWAEDGSIFMTQDEQLGLRAWWTPYNGYLHLLPRLIAWIASHTADVAWWPAIYNGLAFAFNVALFARLGSRRVELPAKAWLMLAFALVVGTGEVLINVTNLQWVTAFFLLLQLFTARPANAWQRLGDLAILVVVGLNGPFALLFLPLFAWRAWRDRTIDAWLGFVALAACAAVQGTLLTRTGAGVSLEGAGQPFQFLNALSIVGSRLVTWPIFGPAAVRTWQPWVHATLALVVIAPLLAGAWRADARQKVRLTLAAAFALATLACVVRVRADLWAGDGMVNGDRYFYLPRVLLAWLLILEFDARRGAIAWFARGACLVGVAMHAPYFILPALPDYRWLEHCDPIRRGVPANIPTLPIGWEIEYPGRAH